MQKLKHPPAPPAPTPRQRTIKTIKIIALALLSAALFLVLADVILAAGSIHNWTHPEKTTWDYDETPASVGLDYYSFEVETENGTVYGWKMAAQQPMDADADEWVEVTEYSDKTILLAPNYDGNRQLYDLGGMDYYAKLCAAGYNVIVFDWTGSGYSDGTKNVFALDKTEEMKSLVKFAAEETGASFLAVQGIGFGCYPVSVAAAECEEVDAVILDSSYETFSSVFYGNFGSWTVWNVAPVRETVRLLFPLMSGVDEESVSLADPINGMNGKYAFFIQGEDDELFGSEGVQNLYALARTDNQASLWLVPDTGHLRARSYDGETYCSKVISFLKTASCGEQDT